MIVICTKCQAKFRVADEKIGPRGAKVRCSKCQTVFLVHPVLGTMSVTDGDARHVPATPPGAPAPPAPAGTPQEPFGGASSFAPPPVDPFARPAEPASAPAPARDPFATADPFAAPAPSPERSGPPPSLGDPFVAAVTHRSSLPVTDLSDLMAGAAAPAKPPPLPPPRPSPQAVPRPPPAPSLEDSFAEPPPGAEPPAPLRDDPFAAAALEAPSAPPSPDLADLGAPFGADDPFAAAAAPVPASPAAEPSPPAFDAGSLALEDRLTPPPAPIAAAPPSPLDQTLETAEPSPPAAAADPFAGFAAPPAAAAPRAPAAGDAFDPNAFAAFEFEASAGEAPALAEPAAAPAPSPEAAPPPPAPPPRRATPAPAAPEAAPAASAGAAAAAVAAAAAEPEDRIPGARTSRLRMVAVNAVALVALLAVALTLYAVWRTEGPLEAGSLRPSALLSALGRGGAAGPWVAQELRSGVYDRIRGAPLLFVRGRVVSRSSAPVVPGVKVAVQVLRAGKVIAAGEALAGAVPTEEELYLACDDAAVAAATRAARSRAPAAIRSGDAVPFLVAIGDAPPDLDGATVQIELVAAGGTTP